MAKKLTYEFVKESFESEGYTLLSKEYKGAHVKLDYICPKGHKHNIIWDSWRRGRRCAYCSSNMKLNIKGIKESFIKEGYTLISNKYINSKTKLGYKCSSGHHHSITWSDWNSGYRCPYCNGRPIVDIEKISEVFIREGYTLLSKIYINNKKRIDYICPQGHRHAITWNDWGSGYRCPTCANIKMSGPGHPNWRGGTSFEPYCSIWKDKEFKSDILERDRKTCLNPYCDSPDSNDLTVHHINYDKKDCRPVNLITVCRSCNSKANKDRQWHKAWYQTIMYKRGYTIK